MTVALQIVPDTEPKTMVIKYSTFLEGENGKLRNELRKQQRGIMRLKKKLYGRERTLRENEQLRKQVRAQKRHIDRQQTLLEKYEAQ